MDNFFVLLFCIFNPVIFVQCQNTVELLTHNGRVKGYMTPLDRTVITKFLGIPFAKPPVGPLRFKKPEAIGNWSGVLDAKDYSPSCFQVYEKSIYPESEDCLYLNVFVPGQIHDAKANPKTVMVWIYGGAYTGGSANTYPADMLASFHDIIVVTFNYRLALFGFMSTADGTIPGNMALYDQLTVLKWVNKNIAAFGGDVSKITIFGESAGADSVVQHLLSPLSEKLFQRGIIQSYPQMPLVAKEQQIYFLRQILSTVCLNASKISECVAKIPAHKLVELSRFAESKAFPLLIVDGEFITALPEKKLMSGSFNPNKEIIIGYNGADGNFAMNFIYDWQRVIKYGISGYEEIKRANTLPTALAFYNFREKPNKVIMENLIHQKYLSCVDRPLDLARNVLNIFTDASFLSRAFQVANAYASYGAKVYLYEFDHYSTYEREQFQPRMKMSAGHADEIPYVFGFLQYFKSINRTVTDGEMWLSYSISKAFTEFAKTGQPIFATHNKRELQWLPYTITGMKYLKFTTNITEQSLQPVPKDIIDRASFWNKVIAGIQNMDTCDPYKPNEGTPTPNGSNLLFIPEIFLVILAAVAFMAKS